MPMRLSVLIPTHRRPEAINACLTRLASQRCAADFEIVVGLDGPEEETPHPETPGEIDHLTRVIRYPRLGLIGVRRGLLEAARGEIVLWLNDDAYAAPGLLEAHLRSHEEDPPRVITGRAAWKPIEHPDLFDRVVQETGLIFFPQPTGSQARPTDYRNCFGLNMSFPRDLARRVGGLARVPENYGYEDIELAWRLRRGGAELWYAPLALVTHDHRYRPSDLHRREYLLGRAAYAFARINPEFSDELFGRDVVAPTELEYARQALRRERGDALRVERSFLSLTGFGPDTAAPALLPVLAEHWVQLKRYLWRWGLLDASRGVAPRWGLLSEREAPVVP